MATLELVARLVQTVEPDTYSPYEALARERIDRRDEDDWPVLATALALGCAIRTEDADFFGYNAAGRGMQPASQEFGARGRPNSRAAREQSPRGAAAALRRGGRCPALSIVLNGLGRPRYRIAGDHLRFYLRLFRALGSHGFRLGDPLVEVSDTRVVRRSSRHMA